MIFKHKIHRTDIPASVHKVTFKTTRGNEIRAELPYNKMHHSDKWVMYAAIDTFNNLPSNLRNLDTVKDFKEGIRNALRQQLL